MSPMSEPPAILDLAMRLFDRLSLALGFDPQVVAVAMTISQRGPAPSQYTPRRNSSVIVWGSSAARHVRRK